jgi:hypothetical protein
MRPRRINTTQDPVVMHIDRGPRPEPPPMTDAQLKQRLLKAQSIFIQEQQIYIYNEPGDIRRLMRAQTDFIRTQTYVLRRMGML